MSADNGIYIGKFPKVELVDGETLATFQAWHYRVIHAQAIDNLNFFSDEQKELEDKYQGEDPRAIVEYFGNAEVLSETVARSKAFEMEREILMDSLCPILEYGISTITFKHSFKYYQEHAREIKYPWDKE